MRIMYDSVNANAIPVDAQIVAGYVGGNSYTWKPQDWARFPRSLKVTIAARANYDAKCLDVELYDATPAEAPGWVARQRARGEQHPWVYMNESTWPAVRAEFARQRVPEPIWWVAAYPGSVGHNLYPGAHAHQYMDDGGKDWSVVADFVPGLDPTPQPPPPGTPTQGDNLMAFGPTGTHIDLTVTGTDGHPYHIAADTPEALADAAWDEIGGPTAVALDVLAQGWTADGTKYVVFAKGIDGRVWVSVNRGAWFPIKAGAVGTMS